MNIYTFADKIERVSFVNGAVVLSFSSYDTAENALRNVITIKLSLQNFLSMFRVMQEFHNRLTNGVVENETAAVEAESTPAAKQEPAAKPEGKARPRRAKRRKTTQEQG